MATLNRTRAWIEGDLKAAKREVERLQAELAAVPPRVLTVANVCGPTSGSITVEARVDGIVDGIDVVIARPCINKSWRQILDADAAEALRDWLNYYYPKGA